MRLVLVSGIPATGKSCFGEWLARYHGFLHLDLEKSPAQMSALFDKDPLALIDEVRAGKSDMVIDWGFPPSRACIAKVRELRTVGLVPWWFDGDRDAAFESFQRRRDHPATVSVWTRQLRLIDTAWPEIADLYGDHRIDVIKPGPSYLDPEEIFLRMFS